MGTILITGAAGNIGRAVAQLYPGARGIDRAEGDLAAAAPHAAFAGVETVIHLAALLTEDIDSAERSLAMLFNVMRAARAAGVSRLVVASSVRAEEAMIGYPISYYGAAKLATEALLRAFVDEDRARAGVAMRFGHFGLGTTPPIPHEVLRLDARALAYWMDLAMAAPPGRLSVFQATGRLDDIPADRPAT